MALKCGIVGLPNVGKSTLFNALSSAKALAANYPFATKEPNIGTITVPDERLTKLEAIINPQKVIPTTIDIVDIAGLIRGASKGEGLGNQFLGNIREVNAIVHVVRCFEDGNIVHVDGGVDPVRDKETIDLELIFKDMETVEKQVQKQKKMAKGGDKALQKLVTILENLLKHLEEGKPVRSFDDYETEEAEVIVYQLQLLTAKPIIYVCNVDEGSVVDGNEHTKAFREAVKDENAEIMGLATKSLLLSVTHVGEDVIAVGERGHVLKSQDKGKSWQQIEAVPTRVALTKVVASGQHVWAVGHDATIIHSGDAGVTWQLQFSDPEREVPFLSALFINEKKGFVIGAYGTILSTQDGGLTWDDNLISEELDYHLNDITVDQQGVLVVAGEAGFMFRSEDQGVTWLDVELPYPGSMFGITSLNNEVIAYGLRGHVLRSEDAGVTWLEVENHNQDNWFGSLKVNDDVLVLVGANGARMRYHAGKLSDMGGEDFGDDFSAGIKSGNELILVGEEGIYLQSMYE